MNDSYQLFVLQFETPTDVRFLDLPNDALALVVHCVAATHEDAKQICQLIQTTMQTNGLVKCITHDNVVAAGFTMLTLNDLKNLPHPLSTFKTAQYKVCAAAVATASSSLAAMYKCQIANYCVTREFVDNLVNKSVGSFADHTRQHATALANSHEIGQLLNSLTQAQNKTRAQGPAQGATMQPHTTPMSNRRPPVPFQGASQVPSQRPAAQPQQISPKYNGKKKLSVTPATQGVPVQQVQQIQPIQPVQQIVSPFQIAGSDIPLVVFQQQQAGLPSNMLQLPGGFIGLPPTAFAMPAMSHFPGFVGNIGQQLSFSPSYGIQPAMTAGIMPTMQSMSAVPLAQTSTAPSTVAWNNKNETKLNPYAQPFQQGSANGKTKKPSMKGSRSPAAADASESGMGLYTSPLAATALGPYRTTVRFKRNTADYMSKLDLEVGTYVIVDGDRGLDFGIVEQCVFEANQSPTAQKVSGTVVRIADQGEVDTHMQLLEEEQNCLAVVNEKIKAHNLTMTVWDVAFQFDKAKLTVFYTAPDRQDFRNLCRELYKLYHARIWFELLKDEQMAQGHPYFVKGGKKVKKPLANGKPSTPTPTQSPTYQPTLSPTEGNFSPSSTMECSPGGENVTPTVQGDGTPMASEYDTESPRNIPSPTKAVMRPEPIVDAVLPTAMAVA